MLDHSIIDDKLVMGEGRVIVEVDETRNAMTQEGTFVGLFEYGAIDMAAAGTPAP